MKLKLLLIGLVLALGVSFLNFGHKIVQAQTSPLSNIHHVWVIIEENHDWSSITASNMPNLFAHMIPVGAHALNYHNVPTSLGSLHPSEPNYMWFEGGTNIYPDHTFTNDNNSSSSNDTTSTAHISTLLTAKGISWKSYQDGVPTGVCPINSGGTLYAAKHNPMVFFTDVSGNPPSTSHYAGTECAKVVPFTQLANDLGSLGTTPSYNFITPNLNNDMHDGTPTQADTWLWNSSNTGAVQLIMNSPAYKQDGAIFITWDEGGSGNNPIGMVMLSPFAKVNYSNSIAYSHASFVKTVENIFGLSPFVGHAADASTTDLSDFFTTSIQPTPTSGAPTPTKTPTPVPPTPTRTPTPIPPTPTRTPTPIPPTPTSILPTVTPTPTSTVATPTPICQSLPTNTGSDIVTTSVNSGGTYTVWSRILGQGDSANSFYLVVDNNCPITVGNSSTIPVNQWTWVNYQNGNPASTSNVSLASGSHTLKIVGNEANVGIDRVLFASDPNCIPTGTGDNCLPAPTNTPTPIVTNTPTPTTAPLTPTKTPTPIPPSPTPTSTVSTPTPTPGPTGTVTLNPTDDAYVDSATPTSNFGTGTDLAVDASPSIQNSYIKFDLSSLAGKTITSATLHLFISNSSPGSINIKSTNSNWSEGTMTSSTAPALGSVITTFIGDTVGQTLNINLTSTVQANTGQLLAIGMDKTQSDGIIINSKESSTNKPNLVVIYSTGTTITPTATPIPPTNTPTNTPTPLPPTPTRTPTPTPTNTPTPIPPTPTPTSTPTNTPTPIPPTNTPTLTPTSTPIPPTPTNFPTVTPTPTPSDVTPPSTPTNLTATALSGTQVNLSWDPSTDNASGVAKYSVFRDNVLLVQVTSTSLLDSSLSPNTTYTYFVEAVDGVGNPSAPSQPVQVTTLVPTPTSIPNQTGAITGTVSASSGGVVSGAKVSLKVGKARQTYVTDQAGKYTIPNLPAGTYSVTYALFGSYKSQTVNVNVTVGNTTLQNITLVPR